MVMALEEAARLEAFLVGAPEWDVLLSPEVADVLGRFPVDVVASRLVGRFLPDDAELLLDLADAGALPPEVVDRLLLEPDVDGLVRALLVAYATGEVLLRELRSMGVTRASETLRARMFSGIDEGPCEWLGPALGVVVDARLKDKRPRLLDADEFLRRAHHLLPDGVFDFAAMLKAAASDYRPRVDVPDLWYPKYLDVAELVSALLHGVLAPRSLPPAMVEGLLVQFEYVCGSSGGDSLLAPPPGTAPEVGRIVSALGSADESVLSSCPSWWAAFLRRHPWARRVWVSRGLDLPSRLGGGGVFGRAPVVDDGEAVDALEP